MSDYRAIAGVSATLRALLRDRMEMPPGFTGNRLPISIGTPSVPPEQTSNTLVAEDARLNIFLYQIQENAHLKNRDLPGRGSSMAYGKPPLGLNLNVMLTGYGSEVEGENTLNESLAQFLLGSAMRVLHDYPVITPQLQTVREPYGQSILHESLRDAEEPIKLCLDPITLEDLTKVWTALTIPYRLSVAYSISVVQIESQTTRRYPRLVGEPPSGGTGIVAVPLDRPIIDALTVHRAGDPIGTERTVPYARVGDTLIINGNNFNRAIEVDINGLMIPVEPLSGLRIEVVIPDAAIDGETIPLESRLQPGAQPVEVLSAIEGLGTFRMRSNRVAFMLVPLVTSVTTVAPRTVTIHGRRLYLADSSMQTLIGNALFNGDAYDNADPTQITVTLPDVLPNRSAACFVGQPITNLAGLDPTPELRVTIGGDGPHTLALTFAPDTLEDAVIELENALHSAPTDGYAFIGARVALLGDRLVIVPGGLQGAVTVEQVGGNAANILGLRTGANRVGYISGMIAPFQPLTSAAPAFEVQMDGSSFDAALADVPRTIEEAAALVQDAIQAGPSAAYTNTQVIVVFDQLLILTGGDAPVEFFGIGLSDETTVAELHLHRDYPLRVRVNGAESLGDVTSLELPL